MSNPRTKFFFSFESFGSYPFGSPQQKEAEPSAVVMAGSDRASEVRSTFVQDDRIMKYSESKKG